MGLYEQVHQGDSFSPLTGGGSDTPFKKPAQRDVLDFEKMMADEPANDISTYDSGVESVDQNIDVIDYSQIDAEFRDADSGGDLFQRSLDGIEKLQDEWVQTIGKLENSEPLEIDGDNIDSYVGNMREMADNTRDSLFVATKYQTITSFGSIILQQLGNLMSFIKQ
ncbi:MAG: hypothetical protein PVI60_03940 [Desulfobacteraceae bacterium]|jgi:hypothetical protein